jgi:hypothetical protein
LDLRGPTSVTAVGQHNDALTADMQAGEAIMELCSPTVLARLPRPFPRSGKVQFGSVWGLRNGRTRKRHELCAAVDGDSLNIYSVSSSKSKLLRH